MRSFDEWVNITVKAMEDDIADAVFQEISGLRHETPTQSRVSEVMAQFQKESQKSIQQWQEKI